VPFTTGALSRQVNSSRRDSLWAESGDVEPLEGSVLPANIQPMTGERAGVILDFVNPYRVGVEAIVCQCEQGMSRSPAVAAGLCELWGQDAGRFFEEYQPNRHVYRLVLRVRNNLNIDEQRRPAMGGVR
jgi:hypothetical protein